MTRNCAAVAATFFFALLAFAALVVAVSLLQDRQIPGLLLVPFAAVNNFISSLPAAVGGAGVLAALVLAIIALLVAGGASDRVEELTEKMEELAERIEELESKDEGEDDSW